MQVSIMLADGELTGRLTIPAEARMLVLLVQTGSDGRRRAMTASIARALEEAKLGTLLVDLLTSAEELADLTSGRFRFDMPFLIRRATEVANWVDKQPITSKLALGLCGCGIGAAAALAFAASRPDRVAAVVSCAGRPDLVFESLPAVRAKVLLITGENDTLIRELNHAALARLRSGRLKTIPDTTSLFEESSASELVAATAVQFFLEEDGVPSRADAPT